MDPLKLIQFGRVQGFVGGFEVDIPLLGMASSLLITGPEVYLSSGTS